MGAVLLIPVLLAVVIPVIIITAVIIPLLVSVFAVGMIFLVPLLLAGSAATGSFGMVAVAAVAKMVKGLAPVVIKFVSSVLEHKVYRKPCENHDVVLVRVPDDVQFGRRCERCLNHIPGNGGQGGENDAEVELGYFCDTCGREFCITCYQAERLLETPSRTVSLPFHALFEAESTTRSLMERGYAVLELDERQKALFHRELAQYERDAVDGCYQARQNESFTPLMRELKWICLNSLPSSSALPASTALLSANFSKQKAKFPALVAHDATLPPPVITAFIVDEKFQVGTGLRVVDKRIPGVWLRVSCSLSLPESHRTFVCLMLGEGVRLFADDARLRPCLRSIMDSKPQQQEEDAASSFSYVTLDVQLPAAHAVRKSLRDRIRSRIRNSMASVLGDKESILALQVAGLTLVVGMTVSMVLFAANLADHARSRSLGNSRGTRISKYL